MSDLETGNECGVRCPRQLECVRNIGTYEVLIDRNEREAFAIDMAWKVSRHAGEESPIIEHLKQTAQTEIDALRLKIDDEQRALGRAVLAKCDGPEISIKADAVIKWECMAEDDTVDSTGA